MAANNTLLQNLKNSLPLATAESGQNLYNRLAESGIIKNPALVSKLKENGVISPDVVSPNEIVDSSIVEPQLSQEVLPVEPINQEELALQASPMVQAPTPRVNVSTPSLDNFQKKINQAEFEGNQLAAQQATFAEAYDKKNNENALKQQLELDAITQRVDNGLNKAQEKLDQIANNEIDPDRVFKDMSVGKKIGLAILTGISGDKGTAVLDRMIKQDIAAQENLKNSQLDSAKASSSMYKDLMDIYKSKSATNIALQGMQYQAAQMKINALAAQTNNVEFKAKLANMSAEIDMKKQELAVKMQEELNKQEQMKQVNVDPVYSKIQSLPISEAQKNQLYEAKEVQDATNAAFKTIDSIFDEAKEIDIISGNIPFSDAKASVEANNANIESAIRATMKGQGTIQEAEIDRLVKPLLPLPKDSKSVIEIKKQKLKQLLNTKNAGQIGRLKNFGLVKQDFNPKTAVKN